MDAAIAQLTVMEVGLLGTFTSQFGDAGHGLALPFTGSDLFQNGVGDFQILMQEVVHLQFDEVAHILIDRNTTGTHCQRTQFNLRLTLEHWFFDVHRNSRHNTVTDVTILKILVVELFDGLGDVLLEGTLMGTALCRVLTVHKRIIFLAILVGMGESNLDVLALHVNDGIHGIGGHVV